MQDYDSIPKNRNGEKNKTTKSRFSFFSKTEQKFNAKDLL
jgi:hypothetical protein